MFLLTTALALNTAASALALNPTNNWVRGANGLYNSALGAGGVVRSVAAPFLNAGAQAISNSGLLGKLGTALLRLNPNGLGIGTAFATIGLPGIAALGATGILLALWGTSLKDTYSKYNAAAHSWSAEVIKSAEFYLLQLGIVAGGIFSTLALPTIGTAAFGPMGLALAGFIGTKFYSWKQDPGNPITLGTLPAPIHYATNAFTNRPLGMPSA